LPPGRPDRQHKASPDVGLDGFSDTDRNSNA
jgi:hypothetical protein